MANRTVPDKRTYDWTNVRVNQVTALKPTTGRQGAYVVWECVCDCGAVLLVTSRDLSRNRPKNCGCQQTKRASGEGREYSIWTDMKTRCNNPNNKRYSRYGGRGIRICEHWNNDFAAFLADMGPCPNGLTLERKNNDGDYEPGNCEWATYQRQHRNTSHNRWLTLNGRTQCLIDWAKETGLSQDVIYARINQLGWSVERALTVPLQCQVRRRKT